MLRVCSRRFPGAEVALRKRQAHQGGAAQIVDPAGAHRPAELLRLERNRHRQRKRRRTLRDHGVDTHFAAVVAAQRFEHLATVTDIYQVATGEARIWRPVCFE